MKLFTHVAFLMLFALPVFASAQTTPLGILEKPKPEFPKDYGQLDVIDSFFLRVEFLADGKIRKVVLISGTHKELARLAADAAKRIKFKPKMENGVPVNSFMVVQYSYSYYDFWGGSPTAKPSESSNG